MDFSEDTEFIDDSFSEDTATITSNVGGKKDKHFSRNYAWCKHAADRGKLSKIVVRVVANGENYRTIDAFRRAIGKPHPAVRLFVDGDVKHALAVVLDLQSLVPLADAPIVEAPAEPVEVPEAPEAQSIKAEMNAPEVIVEPNVDGFADKLAAELEENK